MVKKKVISVDLEEKYLVTLGVVAEWSGVLTAVPLPLMV